MGSFHFIEIGKFPPEIYEKCEARKFHSWKYKNFFGVDLFYFFELGLKSGPGSPTYYHYFYLRNISKQFVNL